MNPRAAFPVALVGLGLVCVALVGSGLTTSSGGVPVQYQVRAPVS